MKTTNKQLIIDGDIAIENLIVAEKVISRMIGLLRHNKLPQGCAMLLKPCSSIHTVGMKFALDVIFLDREMRVVRSARGIKPNRFVLGGRGAYMTVEMEAGWFDMSQVCEGTECLIEG